MDSLTIWFDRDREDEEGIKAERDVAIVLSTGDHPPHTNDVGDADEEDDETGHDEDCERYDRARARRSGRHSHGRRLHSCATACLIPGRVAAVAVRASPPSPRCRRVGGDAGRRASSRRPGRPQRRTALLGHEAAASAELWSYLWSRAFGRPAARRLPVRRERGRSGRAGVLGGSLTVVLLEGSREVTAVRELPVCGEFRDAQAP